MNRVEAVDKVTGRARYAYEQHAETAAACAYPVQSPTASGFVRTVDFGGVRAMPGVLAVLSCTDPPELGSAEDPELALFATREISYRGQLVAAVVADTLENARAASAARIACGRVVPLDPNPPPTCGEMTRTRSGGIPSTLAIVSRSADGPCVES